MKVVFLVCLILASSSLSRKLSPRNLGGCCNMPGMDNCAIPWCNSSEENCSKCGGGTSTWVASQRELSPRNLGGCCNIPTLPDCAIPWCNSSEENCSVCGSGNGTFVPGRF